jgi:hypothetical protein
MSIYEYFILSTPNLSNLTCLPVHLVWYQRPLNTKVCASVSRDDSDADTVVHCIAFKNVPNWVGIYRNTETKKVILVSWDLIMKQHRNHYKANWNVYIWIPITWKSWKLKDFVLYSKIFHPRKVQVLRCNKESRLWEIICRSFLK